MPLTEKEREHQRTQKLPQHTNGRDILNEIFIDKHAPAFPKVIQAGLIDADITYELARGKVPDTDKEYYTLKITSHRRDTEAESILMSGVFLTRHDAQSYIDYLKSKSGPPQGM